MLRAKGESHMEALEMAEASPCACSGEEKNRRAVVDVEEEEVAHMQGVPSRMRQPRHLK
jgi:hypothetical protein